ncbi:survival motor neuron protein-like isoform X2 [Bombus huntii]|uniref:survival motor neuron protein-like isoform X2 n=1 Tax=Bombus huntii TaxID=85661 RepID=UPI0021AA8203|nr:survival motor neuron protein-like isoform X2 [Bombus huntii]XP_050494962.1 survival motor neuron protein-like isoform X2 [Bombus huntii]XP_050495141.1 survival motor neuron protein-like isoform X1 [Bombus huntii]XP_050495142.1 survival motor neuron protein-like isoform X1 [Bombus huntii]XP_050495483.1 survival motor neuron protein-like isoform X2 [Bombus huntii]XP_050496140.1 survival motor neuron protein-like isoform X2 [Bombus huntii]
MADDMNVLFIRGNGNVCMDTDTANDNVWDDSALIEAYDKAIYLAKEEVIKRMGMDVGNSQPKENLQNLKQPKHASKLHKKWIIGAPYRAIYSEDGETYEAIISKIYENNESEGLQSQIAQQKKALEEKFNEENDETCETNFSTNVNSKKYNVEKMDCDSEEANAYKHHFIPGPSFNSMTDIMPPAPPLPPQLMAKLPDNDTDALSSMLMSWYISGYMVYYTGYYHGLKQARNNQENRKNC